MSKDLFEQTNEEKKKRRHSEIYCVFFSLLFSVN